VFLLHGSIENARVFYTRNGKGLGPYLASRGFDVYAGDLRGRGDSVPPVSARSTTGQTAAIVEEIPALARAVAERRPGARQHWIAHSWGGVLMAAHLARFPERLPLVDSLTCFSTKRVIRITSLAKGLIINLMWDLLGRVSDAFVGYFPARFYRLGSDDESQSFHSDIVRWVRPNAPWVDSRDGFDYRAAARRIQYPPTLHLVGCADPFLGHPSDVRAFLLETGATRAEYRILGKRWGNRRDYGHIDILTHPLAVEDHFPWVVEWLRNRRLP